MSGDKKVEKKVWQKPELVILTRSTPEEAVLTACKLGGATTGPTTGVACSQASCLANKNS